MKKLKYLTILAFGLFAISPARAAEEKKAVNYYLELDTGGDFFNTKTDSAGNDISQSSLSTFVYFAPTVKVNDRFSVTPELGTSLIYRDTGANGFGINHEYLRVTVSDSRLARLSDSWTMGMAYRYVLPTQTAAQQAGNVGQVTFRPAFTYKHGIYTFLGRQNFVFNLIRNAYQLNPPLDTKDNTIHPAGNVVYANVIELFNSFDLPGDFYIQPIFILSASYRLGAPERGSHAAVDASWGQKFVQEYLIGYGGPKLAGIGVELGITHESVFGEGKTAKFFSGAATYTLNLNRTF